MTTKFIEMCAHATHEVNRAWCIAHGDDSQPTWDKAPNWQRDSAIAGVEAIIRGDIKTPEDSHKAWYALKKEDGWVYGKEKDPEAKTHPCLVPYAKLPMEKRAKDALFVGTVNNLRILDYGEKVRDK